MPASGKMAAQPQQEGIQQYVFCLLPRPLPPAPSFVQCLLLLSASSPPCHLSRPLLRSLPLFLVPVLVLVLVVVLSAAPWLILIPAPRPRPHSQTNNPGASSPNSSSLPSSSRSSRSRRISSRSSMSGVVSCPYRAVSSWRCSGADARGRSVGRNGDDEMVVEGMEVGMIGRCWAVSSTGKCHLSPATCGG